MVADVRLVPFADEHVAAFTETIRDPAVLRFTGTPDPTPPGWVTDDWLPRFAGADRASFAVLDPDGTFLGYAVTGPIDRERAQAELGYAVSPWARGRGVATATLLALTDWAFAEGIVRAELLIAVANPASSAVAARCGYTLEGVRRATYTKNGGREDFQVWSRLPTDPPPGG